MIDIQNKSKEFKNDSLSWPPEDIEKLLSRMRLHIPRKDNLKHQSRAARLPWNLIAFDDYTDSLCQHMWNLIFQRLRGFRLLEEVLSDAVEWLQHPWTDFYGRKSKNQHPDHPKKPSSAFFLYCADHAERVKEEFPKLSLPERTKVIAERYRNLKEKKKAKYVKRAELSKQEYLAQLEIFYTQHPEVTNGREKLRKQPKKITAFNLYVEEQHKNQDLTNKTPKDAFTLLRKQWKELPADDQLPWLQAAEEKQREIIMTDPSAKSTLTKAEKKMHDRHNGKPDKPPSNVYSLYSKQMLGSGILAEFSPQERMKEIGRRWKTVSPKERTALTQQLKEEKMQYEIDLKKYLKQYPEEAPLLSEEKPKNATKKRVRKNTVTNADEELIKDNNFDLYPSILTPTKKRNTKDEVDTSEAKTPKSINGNLDVGKKKKKKTLEISEEVEPTPVISDTPKTKKRKQDEEAHQMEMETTVGKPVISDTPKTKKRKQDEEAHQMEMETTVGKKKKKKIEEAPAVDLNVSLNETLSQKISLFEGEPRPPPKSPIKLFAKSMKKQKVKYASEEELNEAWDNLSSLERKTYKKALKKAKEIYMAEFEAFLCSLSSKDLKKYKKSKIEDA